MNGGRVSRRGFLALLPSLGALLGLKPKVVRLSEVVLPDGYRRILQAEVLQRLYNHHLSQIAETYAFTPEHIEVAVYNIWPLAK